jgi:polynucleotide 5'-kinase involved in rRNA processing
VSPVHQALLAIAKRDGTITPEVVVAEAADQTSPLHRVFEWDDSAAAEQWRLVQARSLMRRYRIVIETSEEETVKVRAFSHTGTGYQRTDEAMAEPASRDFIFAQAVRELAALRRKYQALVDFDAVIKESAKKRTRTRQKAA